LGFDFSLVDSGDVSDYEKALKPNTKVVYIETPSNPLLKLIDVAAIAAFAKKHNLISVIDNTFASPIKYVTKKGAMCAPFICSRLLHFSANNRIRWALISSFTVLPST
jgi:O-acetylhomoserine/O-acetylserine sulfhydrylase-like pyridoxal-dependent enzyme